MKCRCGSPPLSVPDATRTPPSRVFEVDLVCFEGLLEPQIPSLGLLLDSRTQSRHLIAPKTVAEKGSINHGAIARR